MNIVTTNLRATSGEISWNGMEIHKLGKEYRKIVGYVPQQQALYPDFTVIDFMQYVALLREVPADSAKRSHHRYFKGSRIGGGQSVLRSACCPEG